MSVKLVWTLKIVVPVVIGLTAWAGCSTSKVASLPPVPPTPPGYVEVPHPEGLDYADLLAIFTDLKAPSPETMKTCDAEFFKLRERTNSKEELFQGARELVKIDPVRYHWCFYSRMLNLEDSLKEKVYLDERQKEVLKAYLFVSPIAKAFHAEYQDSRYMRWAVTRYRRLSEHVFYRRLEMSPQSTQELAGLTNPFALVRPAGPEGAPKGILEKYGIVVKPEDVVKQVASQGPNKAVLPGQPGAPGQPGTGTLPSDAPATAPAPAGGAAVAGAPAPASPTEAANAPAVATTPADPAPGAPPAPDAVATTPGTGAAETAPGAQVAQPSTGNTLAPIENQPGAPAGEPAQRAPAGEPAAPAPAAETPPPPGPTTSIESQGNQDRAPALAEQKDPGALPDAVKSDLKPIEEKKPQLRATAPAEEPAVEAVINGNALETPNSN